MHSSNFKNISKMKDNQKFLLNVITRWANFYLQKKNFKFDNIKDEIKNGINLIHLVSELAGHEIPRYNKETVNEKSCIENLQIFIQMCQTDGLSIPESYMYEIYRGKIKYIYDTMYKIITHFVIKPTFSSVGIKFNENMELMIINYVNEKFKCHENIHDYTKMENWRNGILLSGIVNLIIPNSISNWKSLDKFNGIKNNNEVIKLINTHIKPPVIFSAEEIVNVKDKFPLIIYLSEIIKRGNNNLVNTVNLLPDPNKEKCLKTEYTDSNKIISERMDQDPTPIIKTKIYSNKNLINACKDIFYKLSLNSFEMQKKHDWKIIEKNNKLIMMKFYESKKISPLEAESKLLESDYPLEQNNSIKKNEFRGTISSLHKFFSNTFSKLEEISRKRSYGRKSAKDLLLAKKSDLKQKVIQKQVSEAVILESEHSFQNKMTQSKSVDDNILNQESTLYKLKSLNVGTIIPSFSIHFAEDSTYQPVDSTHKISSDSVEILENGISDSPSISLKNIKNEQIQSPLQNVETRKYIGPRKKISFVKDNEHLQSFEMQKRKFPIINSASNNEKKSSSVENLAKKFFENLPQDTLKVPKVTKKTECIEKTTNVSTSILISELNVESNDIKLTIQSNEIIPIIPMDIKISSRENHHVPPTSFANKDDQAIKNSEKYSQENNEELFTLDMLVTKGFSPPKEPIKNRKAVLFFEQNISDTITQKMEQNELENTNENMPDEMLEKISEQKSISDNDMALPIKEGEQFKSDLSNCIVVENVLDLGTLGISDNKDYILKVKIKTENIMILSDIKLIITAEFSDTNSFKEAKYLLENIYFFIINIDKKGKYYCQITYNRHSLKFPLLITERNINRINIHSLTEHEVVLQPIQTVIDLRSSGYNITKIQIDSKYSNEKILTKVEDSLYVLTSLFSEPGNYVIKILLDTDSSIFEFAIDVDPETKKSNPNKILGFDPYINSLSKISFTRKIIFMEGNEILYTLKTKENNGKVKINGALEKIHVIEKFQAIEDAYQVIFIPNKSGVYILRFCEEKNSTDMFKEFPIAFYISRKLEIEYRQSQTISLYAFGVKKIQLFDPLSHETEMIYSNKEENQLPTIDITFTPTFVGFYLLKVFREDEIEEYLFKCLPKEKNEKIFCINSLMRNGFYNKIQIIYAKILDSRLTTEEIANAKYTIRCLKNSTDGSNSSINEAKNILNWIGTYCGNNLFRFFVVLTNTGELSLEIINAEELLERMSINFLCKKNDSEIEIYDIVKNHSDLQTNKINKIVYSINTSYNCRFKIFSTGVSPKDFTLTSLNSSHYLLSFYCFIPGKYTFTFLFDNHSKSVIKFCYDILPNARKNKFIYGKSVVGGIYHKTSCKPRLPDFQYKDFRSKVTLNVHSTLMATVRSPSGIISGVVNARFNASGKIQIFSKEFEEGIHVIDIRVIEKDRSFFLFPKIFYVTVAPKFQFNVQNRLFLLNHAKSKMESISFVTLNQESEKVPTKYNKTGHRFHEYLFTPINIGLHVIEFVSKLDVTKSNMCFPLNVIDYENYYSNIKSISIFDINYLADFGFTKDEENYLYVDASELESQYRSNLKILDLDSAVGEIILFVNYQTKDLPYEEIRAIHLGSGIYALKIPSCIEGFYDFSITYDGKNLTENTLKYRIRNKSEIEYYFKPLKETAMACEVYEILMNVPKAPDLVIKLNFDGPATVQYDLIHITNNHLIIYAYTETPGKYKLTVDLIFKNDEKNTAKFLYDVKENLNPIKPSDPIFGVRFKEESYNHFVPKLKILSNDKNVREFQLKNQKLSIFEFRNEISTLALKKYILKEDSSTIDLELIPTNKGLLILDFAKNPKLPRLPILPMCVFIDPLISICKNENSIIYIAEIGNANLTSIQILSQQTNTNIIILWQEFTVFKGIPVLAIKLNISDIGKYNINVESIEKKYCYTLIVH